MEQIKKGDLIMGKNTWTRFIAVSDPYLKLVGGSTRLVKLVVDVRGEEYRGIGSMPVEECVKL